MEFKDKEKLLKLEYEQGELVKAYKYTKGRIQKLEKRISELERAQAGGVGGGAGLLDSKSSHSVSKRGKRDDHVIDLSKGAKNEDDDPRPWSRILETRDMDPEFIAREIAHYKRMKAFY